MAAFGAALGSGGDSGSAQVATTLVVAPNTVNLVGTGTQQLTATVRDQFGNVMGGAVVTWASNATGVATVGSSTGLVTGVASGTATITATSGSAQGTATVTDVASASALLALRTPAMRAQAAVNRRLQAQWALKTPAIRTAVSAGAPQPDFFVATTGLSTNAGTSGSPWDLATALGKSAEIGPGARLLLKAGTYGTGTETFTSTLVGSALQPIKIMANPGDQVAINCVQIDLRGSHTWLYTDTLCNLEVYRSTTTPTDLTDLIRMQDGGDGNKVVNVMVHDAGGVGISPQSETADHETNGCLVYNNGRATTDAPNYGHGIYAHGTTTGGTTRKIRGNMLWSQVGYGIHCFADSGNLDNFDVSNNICFTNGRGTGTDLLVGGETELVNAVVDGNVACNVDGDAAAVIGYIQYPPLGAANGACEASHNYIRGGVRLGNWDRAGFSWQHNTVVGGANPNQAVIWQFAGALDMTGNIADFNAYATLGTAGFGLFAIDTYTGSVGETVYHDLASYRSALGAEASTTYTAADDLGTQVVLTPNDYVTGRGHLFIDNPTSAATVAVDLSPVIAIGADWAIYSAYDLPCATNPGATAVLTGSSYAGGTVNVPMTGTGKTPQPIIGNPFTPVNALPMMGGFLVVTTAAPAAATQVTSLALKTPAVTTGASVGAVASNHAVVALKTPALKMAGNAAVATFSFTDSFANSSGSDLNLIDHDGNYQQIGVNAANPSEAFKLIVKDGGGLVPHSIDDEEFYRYNGAGVPTGDQDMSLAVTTGETSGSSWYLFARCTAGDNTANFYVLELNSGGDLHLYRYDADAFTDLATDGNTYAANSAHTMRFKVTGTGATVTLQGFVDGTMTINTTDTSGSRLTSGTPGLGAFAHSPDVDMVATSFTIVP